MMNNRNERDSFKYTYSAKEHEELRKIREKYTKPKKSESKLELLRRLDAGVTKRATTISLALGIVGALLLGTGMSLIMTDISSVLGSIECFALPMGIMVGLIGIVLISLAYPVYNNVARKEREKIAPEIIRLTDELMK